MMSMEKVRVKEIIANRRTARATEMISEQAAAEEKRFIFYTR